jgi:hypothetical protein
MTGCSGLKIKRFNASHRKTRNCRNLLVPSRVRRQVMAENLDRIWRELRRHATIEMDQQKLCQLATDCEKSRQLLNARPQRVEFDFQRSCVSPCHGK